jgi:photosystem II stability/assembly factor-like uncharacterized protein
MLTLLALAALTLFASAGLHAQSKSGFPYDTTLYNKMEWREIGPFRGGRSIAVAGHAARPNTFYFGATGGGIWKTEDGGNTWINVSDGFLKVGIVGALDVAPTDPNVVYAGTGEACIRGNVMPGEGIYRSLDAGKSWTFAGLKEAQTISKVRIDPRDENIVYAAAFGHVFGQNKDRGVYRSKDGGKSWQKVLYKDDKTGAVDLVIDPNNHRVVYAAMWEAYRNPWSMSSGGPGSGLWKSTDGGDTWTDITRNEGLPKGPIGRIGVTASAAKTGLLWASVEAEEGGLFRSDDAGKTWALVNDDRRIRQRAWYYSHVFADPKDPELVYILNVGFYKSKDGGKTLAGVDVRHGDNHDLWIAPDDPMRMISGNDGGASVSYNGGETWSEEDVATAQFYHVALDNAFPYNVYGAQQDNSTVRIASRTSGFGIVETDWYSVAGGESGYVAVNPENPDVTYGGSYDGYLTRYDRKAEQEQDISPWPDNPMGGGAVAAKYRFQWTYPIAVSHFDAKTVYATANVVFRTTDEGMSWTIVSPDLTRNDTTKMASSGGPITKDNTSVEYYGTIFTFAESPVKKGVLWAGSDDGLVHVSKDDGATWSNVTPPGLPEWSRMSIIDASPHDAGTAYVAANRYKLNDFRPYIYRTTDYGKSWTKIIKGIPEIEFVHVVREDPNRKGLLYAGTERGVYVSFNSGEAWQPLQLNLPVTPVHDLAVQKREKDLVAATHGRSFWILDDLTPLYQITDRVAKSDVFLFKPRDAYRTGGFSFSAPGVTVGKNPPPGAVVQYYFSKPPAAKDSMKLEFYDAAGKLIKSFEGKAGKDSPGGGPGGQGGGDGTGGGRGNRDPKAPADSGMNRFVWNMRYPDAVDVPGAIMWGGTTRGPGAVPGTYEVRLSAGGKTYSEKFEYLKDPRAPATQADLEEQFDFLLAIRDRVSDAHEAVLAIRDIRSQTEDLVKRLEKHDAKKAVSDSAKSINDRLKKVEEEIIQVKIKAGQDALNYPIKLNNKIAGLTGVVGSADTRPTKQSRDVFDELSARLEEQLVQFRKIRDTDLPAFNAMVRSLEVPAVILKPVERPK